MSWLQGVQVREDLPDYFIRWMETIYERKYGEKAELKYITWFEDDKDKIICDFGTDKALDVDWGAFMESDIARKYLNDRRN